MAGPYDIYPAVDSGYNFPPQIRSALLASSDVVAAFNSSRDSAITTAVAQATAQATAQALAQTTKTLTGTVTAFAGATPTADWLICDGSAVSRTVYANLYAVIGTTYGAGDGTTTFNLPNLKGRVPVGLDPNQTEFASLGLNGGEKAHTQTQNELATHTHTQNSHGHGVNDPGHNHSQNDHAHNVYDPGHNHSQNDHGHNIYDPGHGHAPSGGNGFMLYTNGSVTRSRFASGTSAYAFQSTDQNALIFGGVNGSGTGIGIYSTIASNNSSGVSIGIYNTKASNNGSGTGVGVQDTTGSNNNTGSSTPFNVLQPYTVMNYIIHV